MKGIAAFAVLTAVALVALSTGADGARTPENLGQALKAGRLEATWVHFWTERVADRRRSGTGDIVGGPLHHARIYCRSAGRPLERGELQNAMEAVRDQAKEWGSGQLISVEVFLLTDGHDMRPSLTTAITGLQREDDRGASSTAYDLDLAKHCPLDEGVEWYARSVWFRPFELKWARQGDEEAQRLTRLDGWQHYAWWAEENVIKPRGPRQVVAYPERID